MPSRSPSQELSGRQRRQLRALAHHILPVVQIGKDGVDAGVIAAVARALHDHELIKVRILDSAGLDTADAAQAITGATGAHFAGKVGHVLILYRRHESEPHIPLKM